MSKKFYRLREVLMALSEDNMGGAIKFTLDFTKDEAALTAIAEWVLDNQLPNELIDTLENVFQRRGDFTEEKG